MNIGEQYGIKESLEVTDFVVKTVTAVEKSLADGKFNWKDTAHFIAPGMAFITALKGIDLVPAEISELSDAERKALLEHLFDGLNVRSEDERKLAQQMLDCQLQFASQLLQWVRKRKNSRI